MASDISLAVGGGARRMTYAEIATVRGISLPSARRLVLRHRWPRQIGNDGIVRVTVPLAALEKAKETAGSSVTVTDVTVSHATALPTAQASDVIDLLIVTLSRAVDSLTEQLAIANTRADRAERRADELMKEYHRVQERLTALLMHRQSGSVPSVRELRRPWWRRWFQ